MSAETEQERADAARGMERKWICAVRRWLKKVEASRTVYHIVHILRRRPCPIASGHALDGVRTNGYQRLTSSVRVKRELEQYRDSLLEDSRLLAIAANEVKVEVDRLVNEWEISWDLCKDCKGNGGYWESEKTGKRVLLDDDRRGKGTDPWKWNDCDTCDGRGQCEGF